MCRAHVWHLTSPQNTLAVVVCPLSGSLRGVVFRCLQGDLGKKPQGPSCCSVEAGPSCGWLDHTRGARIFLCLEGPVSSASHMLAFSLLSL